MQNNDGRNREIQKLWNKNKNDTIKTNKPYFCQHYKQAYCSGRAIKKPTNKVFEGLSLTKKDEQFLCGSLG
jgi:hypothetical protein